MPDTEGDDNDDDDDDNGGNRIGNNNGNGNGWKTVVVLLSYVLNWIRCCWY